MVLPIVCFFEVQCTSGMLSPVFVSHWKILTNDTPHDTYNNQNQQKTLLSVVCCNNCQPSSDTSVLLLLQHPVELKMNIRFFQYIGLRQPLLRSLQRLLSEPSLHVSLRLSLIHI